MYKLSLVAVGDKMPEWVDQGFNYYQKQINRRIDFKVIEITPLKRNKGADLSRIGPPGRGQNPECCAGRFPDYCARS